jgi:hypothetical protein
MVLSRVTAEVLDHIEQSELVQTGRFAQKFEHIIRTGNRLHHRIACITTRAIRGGAEGGEREEEGKEN